MNMIFYFLYHSKFSIRLLAPGTRFRVWSVFLIPLKQLKNYEMYLIHEILLKVNSEPGSILLIPWPVKARCCPLVCSRRHQNAWTSGPLHASWTPCPSHSCPGLLVVGSEEREGSTPCSSVFCNRLDDSYHLQRDERWEMKITRSPTIQQKCVHPEVSFVMHTVCKWWFIKILTEVV